eukprot:COSAG06_NODE_27686_length_588_cov_1.020450_1_plen_67_part_10
MFSFYVRNFAAACVFYFRNFAAACILPSIELAFSCWKSLAAAATFIPGTLLPPLPPLLRLITGTLAA